MPTGAEAAEVPAAARFSLSEIGLEVSTGPVVDFRMRADLRETPEAGTVPLLYPGHFTGQKLEWPKNAWLRARGTKPNAILRTQDTEKWLFPNGFYCVIRRFTSKEEKRRIVPSVVAPTSFPGAEMLGFENHLNVFHEGKRGLPEEVARGLAVYLGSTAVDEHFRGFSGHTQVNATDLKLMRYPSRAALATLGAWAMSISDPSQDAIDERVSSLKL